MKSSRAKKLGAGTVASFVGAALLVAGCGSSNSSSSASTGSPQPAGSAQSPSSASVTIATAKGPDGTYLTGASGRAVYLWAADTGGKSACSGACAKVWTPVVASSTPSAGGGVAASDLGTITRSDGSKQVAYMGHPLYYYAADPKAGTTKGQGSSSFGAKWWLVGTSGKPITAGGSPSSGASSGGGYSGGSSGGSGGSSGGSSGSSSSSWG